MNRSSFTIRDPISEPIIIGRVFVTKQPPINSIENRDAVVAVLGVFIREHYF
jgi:hypothetical protein